MIHQIAMTVTVQADNDVEAKYELARIVSKAFASEDAVINYSIEETMESYEEPSAWDDITPEAWAEALHEKKNNPL